MLDTVPPIVLASIAILFGFVGLIWSADKFVAGSASMASAMGVAPLIVGLTIVSFGTSAPEVMVSLNASIKGAGDMAIGNAIGSNIANMGLVLGVTTLVAAIPVQKHLLKHEMPVLLAVTVLSGVFLFDLTLERWEGIALLLSLIPAIGFLIVIKQKTMSASEIAEESDMPEESLSMKMAIVWFIIGLVALIICSDILVWGAKTTAEHFGISPLIIGLTVIAIGTSLPELAASVMSALKGHHDIALGNIIGSNMFNLLAVMSIPGVVAPLTLDSGVFYRDFIVMFVLTILLLGLIWFSFRKSGQSQLGKVTGVLFLTVYIGYYVKLFLDTSM